MAQDVPLNKPLIGREFIFVDDVLGLNLPLGEKGFLITYDKNPLELRKFLVRIPAKKVQFWCTIYDIIETGRHISQIHKEVTSFPVEHQKFHEAMDAFLSSINPND